MVPEIIASFDMRTDELVRLIAGFTDAQMLCQPVAHMNHIAKGRPR